MPRILGRHRQTLAIVTLVIALLVVLGISASAQEVVPASDSPWQAQIIGIHADGTEEVVMPLQPVPGYVGVTTDPVTGEIVGTTGSG
jgi:hypothetical protein